MQPPATLCQSDTLRWHLPYPINCSARQMRVSASLEIIDRRATPRGHSPNSVLNYLRALAILKPPPYPTICRTFSSWDRHHKHAQPHDTQTPTTCQTLSPLLQWSLFRIYSHTVPQVKVLHSFTSCIWFCWKDPEIQKFIKTVLCK